MNKNRHKKWRSLNVVHNYQYLTLFSLLDTFQAIILLYTIALGYENSLFTEWNLTQFMCKCS